MKRAFTLLFALSLVFSACNLDDESTVVGGTGDAGSDAVDTSQSDDAEDPCPGDGLEECDGECINVNSNAAHCGTCGNDCAEDPQNTQCVEPSCEQSACVFEPKADGEACTLGDAPGACSGGSCVECLENADCTNPPTDNTQCWEGTCGSDNTCEYAVPDPTVVCESATCTGSQLTEPTQCGADGDCSDGGAIVTCEPYICNDAGDGCLDQCTDASQCVGVPCTGGACGDTFPVNLTLSGDRTNVDLLDEIEDEGWDGTSRLSGTVTIPSGTDIGSNNPANVSFVVRPLPDDSTLSIVIEGRILGAGGNGGNVYGHGSDPPYFRGFDPGQDGGDAMHIEDQPSGVTIEVDNEGIIGGGGGGGAPGYSKDDNDDIGTGGGGGAGFVPGNGGVAQSALDEPNNGSNGTRLTGGASTGWDGYDAGAGGDLGQNGRPATSSESEGTAGAAGAAVVGEDQITWAKQGDIRGAINP
jgi:hypothetical protein